MMFLTASLIGQGHLAAVDCAFMNVS